MNYMPSSISAPAEPWNPATGQLVPCPINEIDTIQTLRRAGWENRIDQIADAGFNNHFAPIIPKILTLPLRRARMRDADADFAEIRRAARGTDRYTREKVESQASTRREKLHQGVAAVALVAGFVLLNTAASQWLMTEGIFDGIDAHHPLRAAGLTGVIMTGGAALPLAFARTLSDAARHRMRKVISAMAVCFVPAFVGLLWKHHSVEAEVRQLMHTMPDNLPDGYIDGLRLLATTLKGAMLPVMLLGETLALIALDLNLEQILGLYQPPLLKPSAARRTLDGAAEDQRQVAIVEAENILTIEGMMKLLEAEKLLNRERHRDYAENYFRAMDARMHSYEQDLHAHALQDAINRACVGQLAMGI
jgi:hypothetical protein